MCDDLFDNNDATVACKQLGYVGAIRYRERAYYGRGRGQILFDNLQCMGTEESLFECQHNGIGVSNCVHSEDVGVVCQGMIGMLNTLVHLELVLIFGPCSHQLCMYFLWPSNPQ